MAVVWKKDGETKRGPSWAELVNEAARKLGFDNPELLRFRGTDLQILEYFGVKRHGNFAGLTNWLYSEMNPPDDALRKSIIHKRLAELDLCHLFYTTNYDDFLERALKLNGRSCRRIAVESDLSDRTSAGTCEVIKFHGDLDYPSQMVLSESHYEHRLRLDDPMDFRFRSDLLGRVVLFLGYSFRDWNVAYLFRLINDHLNRLPGALTGRRAYIAVPDPSDFEIVLFRARNIEVIAVDSNDLTSSIANLLEELRS